MWLMKLFQMKDHCSNAVSVLHLTMLNVLRLHSSVPLHGDARTARLVGSHCMVKLSGPNLAHIGESVGTVSISFHCTSAVAAVIPSQLYVVIHFIEYDCSLKKTHQLFIHGLLLVMFTYSCSGKAPFL